MNILKRVKIFFLFICILSFNQVLAQLSKVHYIPPLTSAKFGNANPESQFIYISTPNGNDIPYTIKPVGEPSTNYITGVVSNNNPVEISLGSGNGNYLYHQVKLAQ